MAKFGGTNKGQVEDFFNQLKKQILSKRQQVRESDSKRCSGTDSDSDNTS